MHRHRREPVAIHALGTTPDSNGERERWTRVLLRCTRQGCRRKVTTTDLPGAWTLDEVQRAYGTGR